MVRKRIRVYGIVQGVGFRPTVDRHARMCGITGTVANCGSYVEIRAEGTQEQMSRFLNLIREKPPVRAVILKMDVKDFPEAALPGAGGLAAEKKLSEAAAENLRAEKALPETDTEIRVPGGGRRYRGFRIVESERTDGEIFISPDIAVCDTCRQELFDRTNRRYLHPFINCTCCGPRFSLLEALPYDRERTSMKKFPMCPECAREYHDPASRRYDAQPVCCNDCGPEVYLLDASGRKGRKKTVSGGGGCTDSGCEPESEPDADTARKNGQPRGREAITRARRIIAEGGIVAVKGIGGFHLACDASNEEAVMRLRRLKRRPAKPFAVMAKDEAVCARECRMTPAQREILTGHQKPILLLGKRAGGRICDAVAPGIPTVGVMLPYAPVQLLLFTYDDEWQDRMPDILVMTSGNVSGAPIASTDEEAEEIAGFCDAILSNNRDIRIRTDDTVMDFCGGEPYMIRRSRGYAPLPFLLSDGGDRLKEHGRVLGIGGELKNTFCLGIGKIFYPSAYVGDMADVRTVRALEDSVRKMETLLETEPEIVAADLHPGYSSGQAAERIARERGIPLVRVQHHYAHVLSCMAENDCPGPVIGVSFDGTGYGTDGTVWGGEFLLSDADSFRRCAHIRPFLQIGGDVSAREGWRIAVSMLNGLYGDGAAEIIRRLGLCDTSAARVQRVLYEKRLNAVTSTSAGRLFDAVSAILGIRRVSTYEGEAATALMYRALHFRKMHPAEARNASAEPEAASAEVTNASAATDVLSTDRLVRFLTEARLNGADPDELAYRFHEQLADMIVRETVRIRNRTGVETAALTGGVFQNTLLLELVEKGLSQNGVRVIRHHMVPPNDGGIALGQALYAMRYLRRAEEAD